MSAPGYLRRLESESIHIFREVVAECEKPVLLYSVGKDSSVLLHLALKAFAPARLPFPLLHIASGWDFRELLEFRDATATRLQLSLLVHSNEEGAAQGMLPWTQGAAYADTMLTQALRQALRKKAAPRKESFLFAIHSSIGIRRISALSFGTCITLEKIPARASGYFRCPIGPKSIFGTTFRRKIFPWCRCISPNHGPWCAEANA